MNNSVAIAQINRIPSDGLSTSLEKEDAGNQLDQEVVDANIASSVMKDIQEINKIPTSFNITSFRGPPTPLEICMPVMLCEEEHPEVADRENATEENALINYQSPTVVASRVKIHLQRWGRVVPIHPVQFLHNILVNRGYEYNFIPTMAEKRKIPSEKQIKDYDFELVNAIRNSDLPTLQKLEQEGRSMSACNRFSESIVHMACRRSKREIIEFILDHGADLEIIDDFGRTPLHDACWRPEPQFDVVTLICDRNLDLLRHSDARGSIPLNYVREEHWVQWCAFLFNQIEKYWALRTESHASKKRKFEQETTDEDVASPVNNCKD